MWKHREVRCIQRWAEQRNDEVASQQFARRRLLLPRSAVWGHSLCRVWGWFCPKNALPPENEVKDFFFPSQKCFRTMKSQSLNQKKHECPFKAIITISLVAFKKKHFSHISLPCWLNVWKTQIMRLYTPWSWCACVWIHSVVSDSLWPHGLQPTRLLCPCDSPGKNTGVGCHALLQGIFPTQGLNTCLLHLLHWQAGSWSWQYWNFSKYKDTIIH